MSEGGLYSPFHAALALKQASGDPHRSLVSRARLPLHAAADGGFPSRAHGCRCGSCRRISSAFKTIPGGQVLGSTSDYEQRILDFSLADETEDTQREAVARVRPVRAPTAAPRVGRRSIPSRFRKVVDLLREQGLVGAGRRASEAPTRPTSRSTPPSFPWTAAAGCRCSRARKPAVCSRWPTAACGATAASIPPSRELRVGHVRVQIPHPFRPGEAVTLGSIVITEVEIVASVQRAGGGGCSPPSPWDTAPASGTTR